MPRVTPTPMHALNPLLRSVLVSRLANLPVADVAAVVGVSDDEVKIGAGIVDDADVVVDVDDDEMEADIMGDFGIGVGVDEDVAGSVVDADHVIAEPLFLRSLSRSAYSALNRPVNCSQNLLRALEGLKRRTALQ